MADKFDGSSIIHEVQKRLSDSVDQLVTLFCIEVGKEPIFNDAPQALKRIQIRRIGRQIHRLMLCQFNDLV